MKEKQNLGTGSVGKLMMQLAIPAIIAQLVNVLYNIVDRIFIGRIVNGEIAMAGIGVAFPIIILISAFSALVGMGGAPLAAIKMGQEDTAGAEKIMSNCFTMLLIISAILTITFGIFKEPILWAFGASEATIGYALQYLNIYLLGTVAVQIALGMNMFINTQGFAKIAMCTVMIGAGINIVLDPIFIFGFDMGVQGAALATIIAQFVSAIWILVFLFGKKTKLKIRKQYIKPDLGIVGSVCALGVSPFIMQATECLVIVVMNSSLLKYGGDMAVSVMTVMNSIMQMVLLPCMGLTQGAQPIISYNFGAKKLGRVKSAFKLQLIACLTYTTAIWAALICFPGMFVRIFNSEAELVAIGQWAIPIFFGGILMFGAQIACQQTFLSLGQAKISLVLALLRKVVLLVPLAYIIPMFFDTKADKLVGVFMAEPIADVLATLTTITCFIFFYKKALNVKLDVDTELCVDANVEADTES